jgi:sugar-specific transcriptional regulator TrmB
MSVESMTDKLTNTKLVDVAPASEIFAAVWMLQDSEFNVIDVKVRADVGHRTIYDRLDDLEELGVVESITEGNSKKWRLIDPDEIDWKRPSDRQEDDDSE